MRKRECDIPPLHSVNMKLPIPPLMMLCYAYASMACYTYACVFRDAIYTVTAEVILLLAQVGYVQAGFSHGPVGVVLPLYKEQ